MQLANGSSVSMSHLTTVGNPTMVGNPRKKLRVTTQGLTAPLPVNYKDIWKETDLSEDVLKTAGSVFGQERSWLVRESYISLYDDIINDSDHHTQIVNCTAGIGKSSFLLYMIARPCALCWKMCYA
eukprot:scaffold38871_cov34-Attheya_sp.AAC.3